MAPPHYIATSQPMATAQPAPGQPNQQVTHAQPPPATQTSHSPVNTQINGEVPKTETFEGETSPVGHAQAPANHVAGNGFMSTGTRPGSANQNWTPENNTVHQSSTSPPQARLKVLHFHKRTIYYSFFCLDNLTDSITRQIRYFESHFCNIC